MQPQNKPTRSLSSGFSIIGVVVAIILILWLINSGWKIEDATVKVGPIEVKLQKPQITIFLTETPLASSPAIHDPIILWIDEREEYKSGKLYLYKDIHFSDSDGDAIDIHINVLR